MPLYEYECRKCGKEFTFLVGVIAENTDPRCPHCRSKRLTKLISRVSRVRGEEEALDRLTDMAEHLDLDDPKAVRDPTRKMGKELGGEMGEDLGDEFEEMFEEEMGGDRGGAAKDETIY